MFDSIRDLFIKKKDTYITFFVILLFFILTILFTYPLISNMHGYLSDLGDPALNASILHHNYQVIRNLDFGNYFTTNAFYPYKDTLLFSETLLSTSLLSYPIFFFTNDIVFTYNIILFLSFFFSALAAYFLSKYYTKNALASIFAGLIFGFGMFRFGQLGHLQILTAYFIPLSILYFEKLLEKSNFKNTFLFSLFFILNAHGSLYHMVMVTLVLGLVFLIRVIQNKNIFTKRLFGLLLLSIAFITIFVGPVYYRYYQFSKEYNVKREISENVLYSSDITSVIAAPSSNYLYGENCGFLERFTKHTLRCYEKILFPGLTVLILVLSCFWYFFKRKIFDSIIQRKDIFLYGVLSITSFIFAFGPFFKIFNRNTGIPLPYYLVYYLFPPAQGIRVPGRWNLILFLTFGVLSSFTIAFVLKRFQSYKVKVFVVIILLTLIGFENFSAPLAFKKVPDFKNGAFDYIRTNNEINVLAQLPLWTKENGKLELDSIAMLNSTYHGKKIINGYSGFNPERRELFSQNIDKTFPAEESISELKKLDVNAILVDKKETKYRELKVITNSVIGYEDEEYIVYLLK
jgi:hypothetical protein